MPPSSGGSLRQRRRRARPGIVVQSEGVRSMGLRASRLSEAKTTTLRRRLAGAGITRVVGVNDGLSAMLAEKHGFGGLWASGLAISAAHGVPDASILTMTEFLAAAH